MPGRSGGHPASPITDRIMSGRVCSLTQRMSMDLNERTENPMSNNLYDFIFPASIRPDAVALRTDDGARWMRRDLEDLAGRIATVLCEAGLRVGDRLAAQVEKSPGALCLYLACLKCGAVYLPINTAYTPSEAEHILSDAEPGVFIGPPDMVAAVAAASWWGGCLATGIDGSGGLLERAASASPFYETVAVKSGDLAAILYTSGTTGRPKGATISHGNLNFAARSLVELWGIEDKDVMLHALPIFHAHGLFIAINSCLRAGASMTFLSRFTVDQVVEEMPHSTLFMGVPTFYSRLLADARLDPHLCGSMRLFTSGSAPLSSADFEAFEARTGHAILERYGMTETTIIAANPLAGARIPGTVGFALPEVQVEIRDRASKPVAQGEVGELVVRGPNVFAGYWRMPELTAAEHTLDGFFKTGDLATMDTEGRITLVGRNKDLIISGGYNVYPQEVEAALNRIEGVLDSAVVGAPHPDFGEGVIAVVEMKLGYERPTVSTILTQLSAELARYKLPKIVFFAEELPRNALGKVQKNQVRDLHRHAFQTTADA